MMSALNPSLNTTFQIGYTRTEEVTTIFECTMSASAIWKFSHCRQTVEPEQLPDGHDPGAGRRGGHSGAHALQRHILPDVGGPLLGEGVGLRGVDEVQEAHERAALWSQPDPQPPLHSLVVAHYQPRQCMQFIFNPYKKAHVLFCNFRCTSVSKCNWT